ncbi:CHASE2 domain-containing protein [Sphingosinicella sp.]|uniref:CHASE2 domain-containing protein n=1 Tax=Sphingosinicella sp. TaxID=1917971 RepID=UPI0040379A4F
MAETDAARRSLLRYLRQIGWPRLLACLLILAAGLYLARFGWTVPLAGDAERALYDTRFFAHADETAEPSEQIALVVYNDATLEGLRKRSPLDRRTLARALAVLNRVNVRSIGIDILIDQVQDEDEELIAVFRAMRVPTWLAFATHAVNPSQIEPEQERFLREFFRRIGPGQVRPASIMMAPDLADGVMRRWPVLNPDLPPRLANAMTSANPAFDTYTGMVDYRLVDPGDSNNVRFPKISIETLAMVEELPADARPLVEAGFREQLQGRYVLIGGDINDLDDFRTPMTRFARGWTKGIEVHAQMLQQQLDGRMPAPISGWIMWLAALLVVAGGALTSLFERGWRLGIALVLQLAVIAGLPFLLALWDFDTLGLPAFGWGGGWLLAFLGVGLAARAIGAEQKRFAQSALGKYLPKDIANEILRDPDRLALRGERTQIYALFTDLEGFTKLSHAITPEQLSELLNSYLDLMSEIVLRHGGTIDKFVGDAVVAFWGAPIARPDDAERALKAAIAMQEGGDVFAAGAGPDVPPVGSTRVGLHFGDAVVGNFGGEGRIQYTAFGDGMNTAARLESANKQLHTIALISDEAKTRAGLDLLRPMGRIELIGRSTPIVVWEPATRMEPALRDELCELWARFDGGDVSALERFREISGAHADDEALAHFVYRTEAAGPGGHFVLGSK